MAETACVHLEVEVDDVGEIVGLHHHREHVTRDAGVVDQNVHGADLLRDLPHGRQRERERGENEGNKVHATGQGADLGEHGLDLLDVAHVGLERDAHGTLVTRALLDGLAHLNGHTR